MVENLQGQSPTEQGCLQSGTRPLPDTPVSSPEEKERKGKDTEEDLVTIRKNELVAFANLGGTVTLEDYNENK